MSLRVCPIAPAYAPVERVWSYQSTPANFSRWWDRKTRSIEPEGEAQPGQRIHAQSVAFGIPWNVEVLVERVDHPAHTLDVMQSLPLGIIIFSHIACTRLSPLRC